MKRKKSSPFFHCHVHSEFSTLDAISSVDSLVAKAATTLRQPAMALLDHGNLSGTVQLYKAGKKYGIPVFPGEEFYLCAEPITDDKDAGKLQRYHLGLLALNFTGYQTLVQLSSLAHTRPRFNRYPRLDLTDLASIAGNEDIALMTGCVSGLVIQTLLTQDEFAAERIVEMYARWIPNTFVELQNHDNEWVTEGWGDVHDADICAALQDIADRVGVPTLVTQDSHYCDSKEQSAHNLMKRMVFGGESNEFSGDSFHLASTEWVEEHHEPEHWESGLEGCARLLELHDLEMPALDKFTPHIPSTKKNPRAFILKRCRQRLAQLEKDGMLTKTRKAYDKRLDHEDGIVDYLGMYGYFCLWTEVVEFCEDKQIAIEARGSSNGSLICYLLGITTVDPLQWNLLFERFLSRDRKKPPDIDMDVEDVRRDELVEFLRQRFGVVQIGTYGALGSRDEDDRGSVLVSYNSYLRKQLGNPAIFNARYGKGIERIADVRAISEEDYRGLRELSKSKVKRSYGVHAAGLLLEGDDQKIADYVPTMLVASSNTTVTQFTMDDVEELGFLKKDILGQRTLTVMRRCQELIGRSNPRDFSWIPLDDKETCKMLAEGIPENGIFQFEGWAMAKGARTLGVRSTNDCILAGALFRPACMASGMTDLYILRRKDKSQRSGIEHPHPVFDEVLKETFGVVLFQEQVLNIMRKLGLDYEGINTFFKIVKDSGKGATVRNLERLKEVEEQWAGICERSGIEDPDAAWTYIEGYTQYGFNKAHSTGYGLRSYRVGYLKCHYPLEYMSALLEAWAGRAKEPVYVKEARRMGIRLLGPDVNISGASWTMDGKKRAIRKGLSSIKGVGATSALQIAENAPYEDIEDLIARNTARAVTGGREFLKTGKFTGGLEALRGAGALASLGVGRDW